MNDTTSFVIDGSLAPIDADGVRQELLSWLDTGTGELCIARHDTAPEFVSQIAVQLAFSAVADVMQRGECDSRISADMQMLCRSLLGDGWRQNLKSKAGRKAEHG